MRDLQQLVRNSSIPRNIQDSLVADIRKIGQEYNNQHRNLQQEFDDTKIERAELQGQLNEARRQLDRSIGDRDALKSKLHELGLRHKRSTERLEKIEHRLKKANNELKQQVAAQEEHLKAKPSTWLSSNPASNTRRNARDPFDTPTTTRTPRFGGGQLSRFVSPPEISPIPNRLPSPQQITNSTEPPTKTIRRRPHLPVGKARQAHSPPLPLGWGSTNIPTIITEPGDTQISTALVIRQEPTIDAEMYQREIEKLFSLIEGWVFTYAAVPSYANDTAIVRSNDVLWSYMMNCTYPGHRQESHAHVMSLIGHVKTRSWFVMRMAIQYCVKDIMSLDAFLGFSIPAVPVTVIG